MYVKCGTHQKFVLYPRTLTYSIVLRQNDGNLTYTVCGKGSVCGYEHCAAMLCLTSVLFRLDLCHHLVKMVCIQLS